MNFQLNPILTHKTKKTPVWHAKGLKNLGNSCFLNAILQSLSSLKSFQKFVNEISNLVSQKIHQNSFENRFLSIVLSKTLNELSVPSSGSFEPYVTKYKNLRDRFLRKQEQQDAHEFMQYILNVLNEENTSVDDILIRNESCPKVIILGGLNSFKIKYSNPFSGLLKNMMQCCNCDRVSSPTYQNFSDISLSIPSNKEHPTLEDCLKYFTAPETLSDLKCSSWETPPTIQNTGSCGISNLARRRLLIARAPKILCLHIRRLIVTQLGYTKLNYHIKFPLELDLAPYCSFDLNEFTVPDVVPEDNNLMGKFSNDKAAASIIGGGKDNSFIHAQENNESSSLSYSLSASAPLQSPYVSPVLYRLVSVTEHVGNHSGGHYTTYKKLVYGNEEKWFHISDESSRAVSVYEVLNNAQAYILYYEKEA